MAYVPADGGFAKYFLSMLDDADRNGPTYGEAIKACIEEFTATEKRAPRVLDIGVGTGMLSGLCLIHGAAHVTSVDVNPTMTALAKEALLRADPTGKRFTVKLVKPGPSQLGNAKFDIIVSEILGTLTTSESMYKYIAIYAHHLNTFGGAERRVYCVPRKTVQYFSVRSYARSELGAPLSSAIEHALTSAEAQRKLVPTNEGGLGLHLPLYEGELVGERLPIHTEHYDRLVPSGGGGGAKGGGAKDGGAAKLAFAYEGLGKAATLESERLGELDTRLTLGVFEWEVELWKGVWLRNTIDAYRAMPLRNQLARGSAWGFFVTDVPCGASSASASAGARLVVRANALNPTTKSTPELVLDGERVGGNVCDVPFTYVTAAADTDLARRFTVASAPPTRGRPIWVSSTAARRRRRAGRRLARWSSTTSAAGPCHTRSPPSATASM